MDGLLKNLKTGQQLKLTGLLPALRTPYDHAAHAGCNKWETWYMGTTYTTEQIDVSEDLWKLDVTNWFKDMTGTSLETLHEFVILKDVSETSPGWRSLLLLGLNDNLKVVQHVDTQNKEKHDKR